MNEPAARPVADGPLVDIADLHFRYGARPILTGVDMRFGRGQVVAVMGGSGSGKTTILRLIGGQLRAESGRVRVAGAGRRDARPPTASTRCAAGWACCSSSARCSPT